MKLLTFLGTGKYQEVTYLWQDHPSIETEFFAQALATWLQPDAVLVFLTLEAESHKNWNGLQEALSDQNVQAIQIPSGKSESELWDIFNAMTNCLSENDEVVIDITHAFRSIPILALAASAFLARAKNVQIKHILYGAFEAKDEQGRAPTFELTPFLTLLDWMNATDQFLQTGDSRRLAELVRSTNDTLWRNRSVTESDELPKKLHSLSKSLEQLSQSLLTVRSQEIPRIAKNIPSRLSDAANETEKWLHPFDVLVGKIQREYEPFQSGNLYSQYRLIEWYLQHGHIVQAITLAREFLVSWACDYLNVDAIEDRDEIEKAISNASRLKNSKPVNDPTNWDKKFVSLKELLDAWDFIRDLRNDVAHCGIRKNPVPGDKVYLNASKIPEFLSPLLNHANSINDHDPH